MSHVLIKGYDPLKKKVLEVLDKDGKVINEKLDPKLDDKTLLKMYETMALGRIADVRAVQYQRQGRMLTYAPNIGQEAAQIGAMAPLKDGDWLSPSFRELNMMLYKGVPLENIYLYWYGNEMGSRFPKETRVLPVNVIIGSQIAIAAGIAMAAKKQGKDEIVVASIGDGGTSHADFNEGFNFGAAYDAPMVIVVQNNQYAISTPREIQTKAATIAQKAIAFGAKGIQVDGNDVLAMYKAMDVAAKHARSGKGPVLIEAITYRIGAHTTSDDPSLYREDAEVEEWLKKDPLIRLKNYLLDKGLLTEKKIEEIDAKFDKYVQDVFAKVEKTGQYPVEEIFEYVYEELTPNQKEQLEEYKKFVEGGRK